VMMDGKMMEVKMMEGDKDIKMEGMGK
jgi:hypothetical protein